jgi:hypothetical protein
MGVDHSAIGQKVKSEFIGYGAKDVSVGLAIFANMDKSTAKTTNKAKAIAKYQDVRRKALHSWVILQLCHFTGKDFRKRILGSIIFVLIEPLTVLGHYLPTICFFLSNLHSSSPIN